MHRLVLQWNWDYLLLYHSYLYTTRQSSPSLFIHPTSIYPYIPSHSSSSSSSTTGFCLLAASLSLSRLPKSVRSSGQVPRRRSHGRIHSRSNRCVGWQGSCTTSGYWSSRKGLLQMGQTWFWVRDLRGTRSRTVYWVS